MNVFQTILRRLTGFTSNANIGHSIKGCEGLFSKARQSIHIVAGELNSELFERPSVIKKFSTLATRQKNPVNIQILYGPRSDPETRTLFKIAEDIPNIELTQLRTRPTGHFMVVDGKHTRVEEFHEEFAPERKAYVTYDTWFLGDKLETEFRKLKSELALN